MRDLLIRWAKAEPERCAHSPDLGHSGVEVKLGDAWIHVWPSRGLTAPSAVQGAVQEAITARGWTWRLNGPSQLNGKREWGPTATVFGDRLGSALGYHGEYGEGVPAAHALLAAYLEAIEEAKRRARIDERWEASS